MGFTHYSGSASNYPNKDTRVGWPDIINIFKSSMLSAGDTDDDWGRIFVGITEAAKEVGVEERVILAIIIKESSGYVGIDDPTDADGNVTSGFMQCEESPGFKGRNNLPQEDTTAAQIPCTLVVAVVGAYRNMVI